LITYYFIGGACIILVGFIWIRLLMDNAKQQKLIAKHSKDIARIRKRRNAETS